MTEFGLMTIPQKTFPVATDGSLLWGCAADPRYIVRSCEALQDSLA